MATSDSRPVLIFDSGIGGLTVLREARVLMPERHFIYVADDAGFPYGGWEEAALKERVITLFDRLLAHHDPEVCVIGCNTAFTLVGADLRAAFPGMRFVGTVPAIKPAAERTRSGLVSVLATPGTVKRAYTRDLIQSFATRCDVHLVGSENLARMAEAYIRGETLSDDAVQAEIGRCFIEKDGRKTDIVVLACTHYPFMANLFRRLAPWPVDWLDPAEAIARQTRRLVPPLQVLAPGEDIAIFTSGNPDFATRRLMQGFGLQVNRSVDPIRLRRLAAVDMAAAAQVHRASFDQRLPHLTGLHSPEEDLRYWREHLFNECEIHGAFDGDNLVGVVAFNQGLVEQLYVAPSMQGRGIGTRLLEIAMARFSELSLWTFQCNAVARRFYEKHGFVAVKETDGSRNEEREPDMRYRWARAGAKGAAPA
ncbi:glutamate racemase [Mycoplana dimorpha]|uniref:Glutamate racemase n=3 Tax=Mycoplana dimorpha TaxID=28320 RepID=A0A2T5ATY7_MYCDI|nr:glutamate racemase [Mycoplana dimorpha]